jgi:hypothetical protein
MLTTCRLVTVSHLCYLPAVARPSKTCYTNYMQEHDRLTLVMLPSCRRVAVSNFLSYLHVGEWPSQTFYPTHLRRSASMKRSPEYACMRHSKCEGHVSLHVDNIIKILQYYLLNKHLLLHLVSDHRHLNHNQAK